MTTKWTRASRLSERHRTLMVWTLLCAGGASFALAVQAVAGAMGG